MLPSESMRQFNLKLLLTRVPSKSVRHTLSKYTLNTEQKELTEQLIRTKEKLDKHRKKEQELIKKITDSLQPF